MSQISLTSFIPIPRANERWYRITLFNRGRTQEGTATIRRLNFLFMGIAKRFPFAWKPLMNKRDLYKPIIVRERIAGKAVMIVNLHRKGMN